MAEQGNSNSSKDSEAKASSQDQASASASASSASLTATSKTGARAKLTTLGGRIRNWFASLSLYDAAVLFIAYSLYMPDQVTSVSSKHLTVALEVPAATTAMYYTKLYSSKTLSNFLGSLIMLFIQVIMPRFTVVLSLFSTAAMLTLRLANAAVFFTKRAAAYHYYTLIGQACCQGMFQTTFYPMAADKMSVLSLSFKLSKIVLWCFQVSMDLIIPGKATWMVIVHLVVMVTTSVLASVLWIIYCIMTIAGLKERAHKTTLPESNSLESQQNKDIAPVHVCVAREANGADDYERADSMRPRPSKFTALLRLLGQRVTVDESNRYCANGCCDLDKHARAKDDLTMFNILKLVVSPFLMCMVAWPFRTFFQPGILPYTLVDRNLCHPILITVMFFSFIVTFLLHIVKIRSKTMSKPWGPHSKWHFLWLCMIPPVLCVPFIFEALHNPQGAIYEGLRNNRVNVTIITMLINALTTVVDNCGYIGVSASSRVEGKPYGPNALRFISINAFIAQFGASFSYRLSTGYLILRKKYVDDACNSAPTSHSSWFGKLYFWIGKTLTHSWSDFINEFHGNINDYVK